MAIFEDLHDRGFWLTAGMKFGGDFLAYQVRCRSPCTRYTSYARQPLRTICSNKHKTTMLGISLPVQVADLFVIMCQGDPSTHHAKYVVIASPAEAPLSVSLPSILRCVISTMA
jgi:tRNA splicing endonuclease